MNTKTRQNGIEQVLSDFRACTLAEGLGSRLLAQEDANRIYLGVTLQPEKVLWQGLRNRVSLVDALCACAGVRHVAALVDDELIMDCADKCIMPYVDMPFQITRDRLRWGMGVLRGQQGDIRRLFADRDADTLFGTMKMMTTDEDAAHFIVLQALGEPASHSYPSRAMRCAVRLGWLDFADTFVDERLEAAFHTMLAEANEPQLLMGLTWMASLVCQDDPACGKCRAFADCRFLSEGFV
jgi:hypothetical protein